MEEKMNVKTYVELVKKEKMNVKTYVELAKKDLDNFETLWNEEMAKEPKNWPEKLTEMEWAEQEVAARFDLEF